MQESFSPSQAAGEASFLEKTSLAPSPLDSQEMSPGAVGAPELTSPQGQKVEHQRSSETSDRYLNGWENRLYSQDNILNTASPKYRAASLEERLSGLDLSLQTFDKLLATLTLSPDQQARAQKIRQEIVARQEALTAAATAEPAAATAPETPADTLEQDQKERDQMNKHWSEFYHQAFNELKQKVDQLDPTADDYLAKRRAISEQVWQVEQGVISHLNSLNSSHQEYDILLWVPSWARNLSQEHWARLRQETTSKTAPVDAEAAPPPSQATETPVNKQDQATYEENRQKWASAKPEYDLQNIHFLELTFYDFLAEKKVPFKQRREIVEMVFHDLGHYNGLINEINKLWQSKLAKARRRRDIARGA